MIIKKQQLKDKVWITEDKITIPVNRLTETEKIAETNAYKIAQAALKINEQLGEFKANIIELCGEVYEKSLKETETDGKDRKGNYTWYNFDRSIKIEIAISERIDFDNLLIDAAREKLNTFLNQHLNGSDDFFKQIVQSAFETSKGRLDAKKVLSLKRHKDRTTNALYHEAMDLIDQSIRRPESKTYFRVYVKDTDGKYKNIELNFSNI